MAMRCDASGRKVLVVEDEGVVAEDIRSKLVDLGYVVPGIAFTGKEAIELAAKASPDLVLMDISLQGQMDGIEAAEEIHHRFETPVVFLTAFSDEKTLESAKTTQPYGFMLKPFTERELHVAIEVALHRKEVERQLQRSKQIFTSALRRIDDAVITTDERGCIDYMNPTAERLTGWRETDALGKNLNDVFCSNGEHGSESIERSLERVLQGNELRITSKTILLTRNNNENVVQDCIAPIKDEQGGVTGVVLVFHTNVPVDSETEPRTAQSFEAVRLYSTGLAHYFNNLLLVVMGNANLARMGLPAGSPAREKLDQIERAAMDGAELARRMMLGEGEDGAAKDLDVSKLLEEIKECFDRRL